MATSRIVSRMEEHGITRDASAVPMRGARCHGNLLVAVPVGPPFTRSRPATTPDKRGCMSRQKGLPEARVLGAD